MEYHSHRFQDYSLMVFEGDELVAVMPANLSSRIVHSHQGLTYGGLVLGAEPKLPKVLKYWSALLAYLETKGIDEIWVKAMPGIYHQFPSDELQYAMFKLEANRYRCDLLSIVRPSQVAYSKDRKAGIQRGINNKLEIREVDDFDEFWNSILIPNLSEKHQVKPVHSLEEISDLKSKFPDNIRQFNAYTSSGEIVAGTTIFDTKQVARSQYISGNADKNKLGSLDLLHHHLLSEVFKDKAYFDFGTSNQKDEQFMNEGLLYWKAGFMARPIALEFYAVKTSKHDKLNSVFK